MTETTLERRAEDPPLVALLNQYRTDLEAALPDGMTPGRFQSVVINQVRATPKLLECVPLTVVASVLMAAQLGLELGPLAECWLIPRRNQGRWEASFQLGYKGLRQLAFRSGMVADIEARIVHDGDHFEFSHGLGGTNWAHRPTGEPGREWTWVYCAARTVNGAEPFEAMSREEVLAHRDRYAQKASDGKFGKAWRENEPEMARKTVTARLCRQLPMSVEFREAVGVDGATPYSLAPNLVGLTAIERGEDDGDSDSDSAAGT